MSVDATRILLVDDHTLFREGMHMLLSSIPGMDVVGDVASGELALEFLHERPCDVVLLDIALPGMNGITATQRLREKHPKAQVVIVSMYKEEEYLAAALKAGARGYLLKDSTKEELRMAVQAARRRQTFISPALSHILVDPFVQSVAPDDPLTPRQKQVLTLLARGLTAKQVAGQLGLSTKTVETHRSMLMERLGLRNLPALVLYAVRQGLIRPE